MNLHLPFWGKITKIIARVNSRILKNSPYIWFFVNFPRKQPLSEWPFSAISRKSYIGYIRENPGIHPYYHFCDLPSKNDKLRLKINIMKFLGIQPDNLQKNELSPNWSKYPWFSVKELKKISWRRLYLESEKKQNTDEKTSLNQFCYVIFCWNQYFYQIVAVLLWYCCKMYTHSEWQITLHTRTNLFSAKKFNPQKFFLQNRTTLVNAVPTKL